MVNQFFYDGQLRRYLTQFIRMLSGFQVEYGNDSSGARALRQVPVIYGNSSRQAAAIIRNNSENMMNSVPCIAVYISSLDYDRERVQSPTFVDNMRVRQRAIDPYTGQYSTDAGDLLNVERKMPVPYKMELKVDIWTSNTEQKHQLIEQMWSIFNPDIELQSTDNYIDWSSLTYVLLTGTTYSSRSVPVGVEENIDITTMTFECPVWINPPALIKRGGVIQKIIANVFDAQGDVDAQIFDDNQLFTKQSFTPLDYSVLLIGNELQLVRYNNPTDDGTGEQIIKRVTANSSSTTITLSSTGGVTVGSEIRTDNNVVVARVTAINDNTITANVNVTVAADDRISFTVPAKQTGTLESWNKLIEVYGKISNGVSQIGLELRGSEGTDEVIGTVAYHPTDTNKLLYNINVDTLPTDTLDPVTAIIDPTRSRPGADFPVAVSGTRYLLTKPYRGNDNSTGGNNPDIAPSGFRWTTADGSLLNADVGDIIECDGTNWRVVFDASATTAINYVTNSTTLTQYRFADNRWSKSTEGYYTGGQWRLILYPTM